MLISNIRIEESDEWARLIADIDSESERFDKEKTIWIGVEKENKWMLSTETYNCFLLLPLYMAMYYHEDLSIDGKVSKQLYHNVNNYIKSIMLSFSKKLSDQKIKVDGFAEVVPSEKIVIGTGLSCGVDCLQTVYQYYEKEEDTDYRINGLFMLNCGWHGDYYDNKTYRLFKERSERNTAAVEHFFCGGVTPYIVDSNLHAFLPRLNDQASYFCIYTCIFALEKAIRRYYISSSYSYTQMINYGQNSREKDWSEYADPYALPLMSSETLSIVSDGCQYNRSQKMELISGWQFAQKYLNVCSGNVDSGNCGVCAKCIRTLQEIEAIDRLDNFSAVFDIEAYKKISLLQKCKLVVTYKHGGFMEENYEFFIEKGKEMPSLLFAEAYLFPHRAKKVIKRIIGKK